MGFLTDMLAVIAAGIAMLSLGLFLGHGKSQKIRDQFRSVLDQNEAEYQRVLRLLDRMKSETRSLTNFMVHMPDFARQINTNIERAKVAPMIVNVLDQMFSAKQCVVFYADEQKQTELYLAESKGLLSPGRASV